MNSEAAFDASMMHSAIALAEAYVGLTSPNPAVGAILVQQGRIIGRGAHRKAGTPHAEANAFTDCQTSAQGATLYVTLEPCSTTGRMPPCCDRIIKERVSRVVIGCLDPNPKHAGRAVQILEAAGIQVEVITGEAHDACLALLAPFAKAIVTGLPYLRLKLAMTLDGAIADGQGSSRWISGPTFSTWVQQLRTRVDAIMVGAGTVRADHPSLQPHIEGAPTKVRVLVDGQCAIAPSDLDEHTLLASRDLGYDGKDLEAMLRQLCARGINDVLCEGGGRLAGALLQAQLVDELDCLYAPKILGDDQATRGIRGLNLPLAGCIQPKLFDVQRFDEDVLLRYTFCKERPHGAI